MFSKLRLFPIVSYTSNGFPTYGEPIKLHSETSELNSIKIEITPKIKTKTKNADNKTVDTKVEVGYTIALTVYDACPEARKLMFGFKEDVNKNQIEIANSMDKKRFGVFFCGEIEAKKFQKYLYDVDFTLPKEAHETESDNVTELPLEGEGIFVEINGEKIKASTVFQGKTGYVESEEPTKMYTPVSEQPIGV